MRAAPKRGLLIAAALLGSTSSATRSHAADAPSAVAAPVNDRPQAPELILRGVALYKDHQYEAARAAFAQAFALEPSPGTLLNLALAELKADHPVEAANHFRQYLTFENEPADKRESVNTVYLPLADAATARIWVFAPAAAELLVDGVPQPRPDPSRLDPGKPAPTSLRVRPGDHDVSARQSTLVETQHVVARGGELVEVHFQRVADAPSAGRPSTVWIRATSPSESPEAPADLVPREKWITVLALGSAAVLAAGLGVGLGAEAKGQASDVQTERATLDPANKGDACIGAAGSSAACRRLNDDVQSAHRNWNLSIASYIGAGALGLAALATWTLWHPQGQKPSALSVQPALASNGGGLLVGSAW